jgi:hypothetical protein
MTIEEGKPSQNVAVRKRPHLVFLPLPQSFIRPSFGHLVKPDHGLWYVYVLHIHTVTPILEKIPSLILPTQRAFRNQRVEPV